MLRQIRFWVLFPPLLVFVGIPLWIKEILTGTQEGRMMDFFKWVLKED